VKVARLENWKCVFCSRSRLLSDWLGLAETAMQNGLNWTELNWTENCSRNERKRRKVTDKWAESFGERRNSTAKITKAQKSQQKNEKNKNIKKPHEKGRQEQNVLRKNQQLDDSLMPYNRLESLATTLIFFNDKLIEIPYSSPWERVKRVIEQ